VLPSRKERGPEKKIIIINLKGKKADFHKDLPKIY
jgi:hypothetical protein